MRGWVSKHLEFLVLLLGGIIATAVSITVFAYTNFSTKQETAEVKVTIRELKEDIKDDIKEIKQDVKILLQRKNR